MLETVRWLETELFNDWSVAHQFQHVVPLGHFHLSPERLAGRNISQLLRSLRSERGDLERILVESFQQIHELTWFYGGWIDQAVFTVRCVRSGPVDLLWEVAPMIDADPIDQAGDSVLGCCDWQHQLLFLAEVSREAASLKLSLRTDSAEIRNTIDIRLNALTSVA